MKAWFPTANWLFYGVPHAIEDANTFSEFKSELLLRTSYNRKVGQKLFYCLMISNAFRSHESIHFLCLLKEMTPCEVLQHTENKSSNK